MNRQLVCPVVSAPAVMWAVAAPLGSEMVLSGERRGYHSPLPSTSRNSQYAIEKEIFLGGWNCLSPQTTHTKKSILWNINLLTYFTGLDNKTEKPDKTDLANGGGKTLWFHCQKCQFSSSPILGGEGDNISWCGHICYISGASQVTCHSDYFRLSPSGQFLFRAALILWGFQFEGKIISSNFSFSHELPNIWF